MNRILDIKPDRLLDRVNLFAALWLILSVIAALKQYATDRFNNYKIFQYVYYHTVDGVSLYAEYPQEYFDHNHYGPLFSVIIMPFALLPDVLGMSLWNFTNATFLLFAVYQLPLTKVQKSLILLISAHEFLTTSLSFQFNPSISAIVMLSYVFIDKKQDFWAAMLIMLGTFIKLYGIVGLAFFFFSKDKMKFILSLLFWALVFFVLPMLISSPDFIIHSYYDWYERLLAKNKENILRNDMQDISLMGMIRKISGNLNLPNLPFILSGMFLMGLCYLRISMYKVEKFRLLLLSSVLIFTVIFSTGSESPTYIIAFMGFALWFVLIKKINYFHIFLLILTLAVSSFSPSDLFPAYLREHFVKPYALKALPLVLVWFLIIYKMLTLKDEEKSEIDIHIKAKSS
jgi:hypothetical protein